jgi:hypothetical protein
MDLDLFANDKYLRMPQTSRLHLEAASSSQFPVYQPTLLPLVIVPNPHQAIS